MVKLLPFSLRIASVGRNSSRRQLDPPCVDRTLRGGGWATTTTRREGETRQSCSTSQ